MPPVFYHDGSKVTDDAQVAAFLQRWLYFGLLSEVTEQYIDLTWFERSTSSGQSHLSSEHLGAIISLWSRETIQHFADTGSAQHQTAESGSFLPGNEQQVGQFRRGNNDNKTMDVTSWTDKKFRTLHMARDVWLAVVWETQWDEGNRELADVINKVCLSIGCLGEYLTRAVHQISTAAKDDPGRIVTWQIAATTLSRFLLTQARSSRWCPNKIHGFLKSGVATPGLMWYLLNLQPPTTSDHHQECNIHRCNSLNVDLQMYTTRHMSLECACAFDQTEFHLFERIVTHGKVPLVTFECQSEGDNRLVVKERQLEHPYVAISHVWAHGLGNRTRNALPSCALRQLQSAVNSMAITQDSNTPFWIDSLCLPRNPVSLRRKAVLGLSEVFAEATCVLVWDSYLRQYDSASMTKTEMVARILISDWTTRLWTFSEGRLAKRIWFQFRDRAVDFYAMSGEWLERFYLKHAYQSYFTPLLSIEWQLNMLYNATTQMEREEGIHGLVELDQIRRALNTRQTSWSGDEALCLAAIFRFDLRKIIDADHGEKMAVFWHMVKSIAPGVVFSKFSPKLDIAGSRWAPATMLDSADAEVGTQHHWVINEMEDYARPSNNGLLGHFAASLSACSVHDDDPERILGRDFLANKFFPDKDAPSSLIYLQTPDGSWFRCFLGGDWHQSPRRHKCESCLPGIIFNVPPSSPDPLSTSALSNPGRDMIEGVFVTFESSDLSQRSSDRPLQVTAHKFLLVKPIPSDKAGLLDEMVHIARRYRDEAASQPELLVDDDDDDDTDSPEQPGEYEALLDIEEWLRAAGLQDGLRASARKFFGSSSDVDDNLPMFLCLQSIHYFVEVGEWYKMTAITRMELCID